MDLLYLIVKWSSTNIKELEKRINKYRIKSLRANPVTTEQLRKRFSKHNFVSNKQNYENNIFQPREKLWRRYNHNLKIPET